MTNVSFKRAEYNKFLNRWSVVSDCVEGQERIKARTTHYLPKPNPDDASTENTTRYKQYVERALYFNVTNRTLRGLIGTAFDQDPVVHAHEKMDDLLADITGEGVSLEQQSKKALAMGLMFGRGGLYVDFPTSKTDSNGNQVSFSVKEREDGFFRPTVSLYNPGQIINWRTMRVGAKTLLSLVVLEELYDTVAGDGFSTETRKRWRVLKLEPDTLQYHVELIEEGKDGSRREVDLVVPVGDDGKPFNYIPFHFFGAENNDTEIDDAPLYDLATINIAHYRNSADYEEATYMVGQPTPWIAGLTANWVKNVLEGKVQLGSRAAIPLPEGGQMGLMEAGGNQLAFESMEHKERQMVALGAKLVENDSAKRTATEAGQEKESENSVLGIVASNLSAAYTNALQDCAVFMGLEPEVTEELADGTDEQVVISYELNTEYAIEGINAEARRELVAEWQNGAITFSEMREGLREAGVATLTDEEATDQIAAAMDKADDRELKKAEAQAKLNPQVPGKPPVD